MGLVLGATILTVLEFVDFLIGLVASGVQFHVSRKKEKARNQQMQQQREQQRRQSEGRERNSNINTPRQAFI